MLCCRGKFTICQSRARLLVKVNISLLFRTQQINFFFEIRKLVGNFQWRVPVLSYLGQNWFTPYMLTFYFHGDLEQSQRPNHHKLSVFSFFLVHKKRLLVSVNVKFNLVNCSYYARYTNLLQSKIYFLFVEISFVLWLTCYTMHMNDTSLLFPRYKSASKFL